MGAQNPKRPAHEVIIDEMSLALRQMGRAQSDIDAGQDAVRDLIWAQSSFNTLLHILGAMDILENVRPWIIEKLNEFASQTSEGMSPNSEIQNVLRRF